MIGPTRTRGPAPDTGRTSTPGIHMRRGILLAFVLTLAVLIGNAGFAIVNTRALVENEQRVVHTHEVLRQIEATLSTVRDAETVQRGYLLTGDESYLEGYRAAAARTAGDLQRLRELTRDDPAQQSRLDALDQQTARKFDLMAAAVEERRNRGLPGVVGRSPGGKEAMDEIRAFLTDMADDEGVRLVARSDAAKVSAAWALLSFAVATALALVAVVWEFNAVRRGFRRRERAAVDLRGQREQLHSILASIGDGVIVTDPAGRVTFLNPVAAALTGRGPEAAGQRLADVFAAVDEHTGRPVVDPAAAALGGTLVTRAGLVRANGMAARPVEYTAAPMQDTAGAPAGTVLVFRDLADRRRAEEAAREQAALLAAATDAILVEDPAGRIMYWNHGAERLYGWPAAEAIGQRAEVLLHGDPAADRTEALAGVAAHGEWAGELRQRRRDGQPVVVASRWTLVVDAAGRPRSRLVINSDVTDKKKLEAQLLRAQRLESVGTLAGGVAHDLNNVLTPILMGLDILRTAPDEDRRLAVLDTVQAAARRGAELVKQVLLFSRGADGLRGVLSLKPLVREVESIITHTFPKRIAVRFEVAADLWPAPVDATQFTQVLMNLAVNARDAMPRGGELLVRAENLTVDDHYARMHVTAKPGRYVAVAVSDTGDGIAADVQERMFDPFFTTKPPGQGTGLGLSTVLGIVQGHGGFINVYSEPGRGAQFVVCLPAAEVADEVPRSVLLPQQAGHGELILVVDDEAAIAQITRATLEAHGYRVVTAGDGVEAVEQFRRHQPDVRAVLTDMMMPVMDGPATIRAIRELDAGVPFIAASGLTDPTRAAGDAADDVAATLPKPFTARMLLKVVRKVLAPG